MLKTLVMHMWQMYPVNKKRALGWAKLTKGFTNLVKTRKPTTKKAFLIGAVAGMHPACL